MSTPFVDVAYKISSGSVIAADHRYHLFSAVANVLPDVHGGGPLSIHQITGRNLAKRKLELSTRSRLAVRAPIEHVGSLLALSNATLQLGESKVNVGAVPEVRKLVPAATLRSAMVTIKRSDKKTDELSFVDSVRKQLNSLGISEVVQIELPDRESLTGEPRSARRTFEIKGRQIIGYEIRLHGLSSAESIVVQEHGVGGRRAMGCGLFKPFRALPQHPTKMMELEAVGNA